MSTINVRVMQGKFSFLCNFYPCLVIGPGDLTYDTVEAAYQAGKSLDPKDWKRFQRAVSPGAAKALGQKVQMRPDWDEVKFAHMEGLLRQKFARGSKLAKMLTAITGTIEEGNTWNDRIWGIDLNSGIGENHLGRLLMHIRDDLNASHLPKSKTTKSLRKISDPDREFQPRQTRK